MLPVMLMFGSTSSGKTTLGERLAAEFNLHNISLGNIKRDMINMTRKPIPGMPEEINTYLANREIIPQSALAHFEPGDVPIALQYYNHRKKKKSGEFDIYGGFDRFCGAILQEKSAELMTGSVVPRAIVVDNLSAVFSGETTADLQQELDDFAPSFSGLTIYVRTPRTVSLKRFLLRNRGGDATREEWEGSFQSHEKRAPRYLKFFKRKGVVVETTNDGLMNIDDAYETLKNNLNEVPEWKSLIGEEMDS